MSNWHWHFIYLLAIAGNLFTLSEQNWLGAIYCMAWMIYCEIKIWRADDGRAR